MRRFLPVILFLLTSWFSSIGQNIQPFVVTYDSHDYNASNKNWSIAVNSKGLVYVGNHEGLLQGDGQTWKLYKIPSGGILRSVAIDKNDRIYTGSFEEFGYWEEDINGQLNYTSLSDSLVDFNFHNEQIWKIVVRGEKVYFQAFSKVFIYNGKDTKVVVPDENIIFLLEAEERFIAQNVGGGLCELEENGFKEVEGTEHLFGAEIKVLLPHENNTFILGSGTRGLYKWKDGNISIWDCEAHEVLKDKQINHGLFFNGSYYVGTITDGVYIFNPKGRIIGHLNTGNSLLNNTILGMCFDAEGNLWLNHAKGLSFVRFNYPYRPVISSANQLGAVHSSVLFENKLYIGTNQGLYFTEVQDRASINVNLNDFVFVEGSQGQVWDLQVFDNQLFCGHNLGTFVLENGELILMSDISGGFCLKKHSENILIQGTYTNMAVYRKNPNGRWQFANRISGFSEPLKYVEVDFRGNVWVSHNGKGIYKLEVNDSLNKVLSSEYFGKNEGLTIESKTHAFKLDNRIVFTSGNGIFTYDDLKDSVIRYEELNKQLGIFQNAERIVEAPNNTYWFILKQQAGLFYIDDNEVKLRLQMNLNRKGYHLVDTNPNIVPISESQHLVCLEDGFVLINPDFSFDPDQSRTIIFREISSLSSKWALQTDERDDIKIPYKNNFIRFRFSPVIFPGDGNRFSTLLEGLETEWSEYVSEAEKSYSRLPAGEYTFRVKGMDEFGQPISETFYRFEIKPAWYASRFALFLYTILAVAFFIVFPYGLRRYYKRQQEKYQGKQEQIFKEKQKEEQLLAEQKIVKLQNQHLQKELETKSREMANNTMVIIRRNETLTEIKAEFEKQKEVLGSRFPNKNYEKIIKLINKNLSNEEEWKVFEDNFDQAHNNFFKRLKKAFPALTPGDLRLCAYLHLNLASKEIAPLLNISVRGVEIHRYRLRKKLQLSTDENLTEFILQF